MYCPQKPTILQQLLAIFKIWVWIGNNYTNMAESSLDIQDYAVKTLAINSFHDY